jgi:hypothetical protein
MPGYLKITNAGLERVKTDKVPTLAQLQVAVSGYIEPMFTVPSPEGHHRELTGYVNEAGLIIGLPIFSCVRDAYGVRPFAGNMVITALTKSGNTALLSDVEMGWLVGSFTTGMFLTEAGILAFALDLLDE